MADHGPPWWRDQPSGNALAVSLVVVLAAVMLAVLGISAGIALANGGDDDRAGARWRGAASPAVPSPSRAPSPSPTPSPGAADAGRGDCLTNVGTAQHPDLVISRCDADSYRVLKRFSGTSDARRCDTVAGTTDTYVQQGPGPPSRDFVLCLQRSP